MAVKKPILDTEQVEKLAAMGCTQDEIARFFGLKLDQLTGRFHTDPDLRGAYDSGKVNQKISIRHKQMQVAMNDSHPSQQATMLIWLGKQFLGQKESVTLGGDVANPLELTVTSAAEILASKLRQLANRGQIDNGQILDVAGSDAGRSALRSQIEAASRADPGTE